MELQLESKNPQDYLGEIPPFIKFDSPIIRHKIVKIQEKTSDKREQARLAFEIARDGINHSFDTKFQEITISGEDALKKGEGICFAKAHTLATLLRGLGIPAGFCYQRVLRDGKTIASGYALHGLNAVYLEDTGWFRLDPRGNKPGINSQFSTEEEKLAYHIHKELGEKDYPNVFLRPLDSVIQSMEGSENCAALFYNRPESL